MEASTLIAALVFAVYCAFAAVSISVYQFLPALNRPRSWLFYAGQQIHDLWHADVRAVEWFSGTLMILWALWLLPSTTFESSPSIYFGMAALGTETSWGIVLFAIGVTHGLARLFPLPNSVRAFTMLMVTAGWMGVAIPLIYENWNTTATPVYSALVAISLWAYVREALTSRKTTPDATT